MTSANRIKTSNIAYRIRISKKKKKNFSSRKKSFFSQLFNFMKWSRLTSSLLLASFVLVSILSLFEYCLFSFSSSSISTQISISSSFSFSWSLSASSSFWCRISSMHSKSCLRVHHLIWHNRLHLHAFELREFSQDWIFERSLSCSSLHFRINLKIHLHLHYFRISMRIHLHLLWSSIFRFERTIAWSYDLRILYDEKRINWKSIFFEST